MSYIITFISTVDNFTLTEDYIFTEASKYGLINHNSSLEWLEGGVACDLILSNDNVVTAKNFAQHFEAIIKSSNIPIDICYQSSVNRRKKLLICDMDSTIIQQECIDELADQIGIRDEIAEITELAMQGKLDFAQSLVQRTKLLAGIEVSVIGYILNNRIKITPGARELVKTMRANGAVTALVSGGFTKFAEEIGKQLEFDYVNANELIVNDGKLSGELSYPILGANAKLEFLKQYCQQHNIDQSSTIAVGDGANDLPMLEYANIGVAYHAKELVNSRSRSRVRHSDLKALLYIQGYSSQEIIS